jgi:hypothetical protein
MRLFAAAAVLALLLATACSSGSCDAENPCGAGELCEKNHCEGLPDLGGSCDACPEGQACVTNQDYPEGACALACDPNSGSGCPSLSSCATLRSGSYCLRGCDADDDCPADQKCGVLAGGRACVARESPAVHADACSTTVKIQSGGVAGPATEPTGCQKPLVESAFPSSQVQHLGSHPVGENVTFTVPPGQASLSIVSQAVSALDSITFQGQPVRNSAVPLRLVAPDGGVFYDDTLPFPEDPTTVPMFYGDVTPTIGTMTFPNTHAALELVAGGGGVPSGEWQVTVNDFGFECTQMPDDCEGGSDAGVYDLTIVTRPAALPAQGTLDVAIYLVTETGLSSTTAPADSHFRRMIASLVRVYEQAGLCVGTITLHDVPDWAKARYASAIDTDNAGSCDPLHQLFTLSQPGNTLNFFFVDGMASSAGHGGRVVGYDGAIPGPSGFGGTISSGAAVSMADLGAGSCGATLDAFHCGADEVALIAAHEGAHWLGLYHTTEFDGVSFDPMVDTASCVCSLCVPPSQREMCGEGPNGAIVNTQTCGDGTVTCGGTDNLMFWQLSAYTTGALTPEQAKVMLANPAVH